MTYNVELSDVRSIIDGTKRYVKMRAVANGADSYNSIFTQNARNSILKQIRSSSVKSKMLHKDTVIDNMRSYLQNKSKEVSGVEKDVVSTLLGQLPMAEFPAATVIDAEFENDNSLVVTAQFNEELAHIPEEKAKLDAYWDMLNNKKITGASMVFSTVSSFKQGDKLFIDDLRIDGIDFVDRPSHTNTRILETFVRAASESLPVEAQEVVDDKVEMVENGTLQFGSKCKCNEVAKIEQPDLFGGVS
jgi:hypothetical protein